MMRIAHSTALSPLVFSTLISCALFGKSAVLAEGTQLSEGNTPECCAKSTNKALPMLKVNDKAPDFRLLSQSGKSIKLSELLGKSVVVVYFYPKDFTSICTKESKAFRDSYEVFKQAGAEVVGISADSVESHKSFAEAEHLPFILLSDSDDRVRKLWRVPNSMGFLPGRVTYVIDKRGVIRSVFDAQLEDKKHVTEALKVIDQLKKESSSKS
jgi:peroxiredoxin Q/BCP